MKALRVLNSSPLIFMICTYTEWPINIQRYMHIFGYVKKVIDKNVNCIIKRFLIEINFKKISFNILFRLNENVRIPYITFYESIPPNSSQISSAEIS